MEWRIEEDHTLERILMMLEKGRKEQVLEKKVKGFSLISMHTHVHLTFTPTPQSQCILAQGFYS
jgi:hypothetical protein